MSILHNIKMFLTMEVFTIYRNENTYPNMIALV